MRSLILFLTLVALITGAKALAELPASPLATHVASLPQYGMNSYGQIPIPSTVLHAFQQKRLSPILMFVLLANIVNIGVDRALKEVTPPATPYLVASAAFERAICYVRAAYLHAFGLSLTPLFSGGGGNPAGPLLAQALGGGENCATGEKGNTLNPMLLLMLAGKGGKGGP